MIIEIIIDTHSLPAGYQSSIRNEVCWISGLHDTDSVLPSLHDTEYKLKICDTLKAGRFLEEKERPMVLKHDYHPQLSALNFADGYHITIKLETFKFKF